MILSPRRLETVFSPLVIVGSACFIAGIAAAYIFVSLQHSSHSAYIAVAEKPLTQSVQASGVLQASDSVPLSFSRAGVISQIAVDVGSHVSSHQNVASLASASIAASLATAKANATTETAKLAQLQAATSTDVLVSLRVVVRADVAGSIAAADAAVETDTSQFIRDGSPPQLLISTTNPALEQSLLDEWTTTDHLLAAWKTSLPDDTSDSSSTESSLADTAATAADNLTTVETFLNHAATLLAYAQPSTGYTAADLDRMRISVVQARLSVADALTALTAGAGKLSIAEAAGPQELRAEQAAVASSTARVQSLQKQLQTTRLMAPIAGTIARQLAYPGTSVGAGQPVLVLSSDAHVQISAPVSANDISKITIGDDATVQLANNSTNNYAAQVVSILPPSSSASPQTYTVVAQLVDRNADTALGEKGNLTIVTASSTRALAVPQSSLVEKNGQSFVLREGAAGHDDLVPVQTGITADDGEVEIISGLVPGDRVRSSISVY